jgi:hypothetical protein
MAPLRLKPKDRTGRGSGKSTGRSVPGGFRYKVKAGKHLPIPGVIHV